jgi:hypothetical protein
MTTSNTGKKSNIMSLSMEQEMQERLKAQAKKKSISVSKLIRDLVDRYLSADDEVIPVILKIPQKLKGDEAGLRVWLNAKVEAVVKTLITG